VRTFDSNYGPLVTVIAPREDILSFGNQKDDEWVEDSGTSQASAAVSGILAHYVGFEGLQSDTNQVYHRLGLNTIKDIVTGFPDTPATENRFPDSGLNNPNRKPDVPYEGASEDGSVQIVADTGEFTPLQPSTDYYMSKY
jgi:hypothetical protein